MKPGRIAMFILTALALLPLIYVLSYFALVYPQPGWSNDMDAHYRLGGETAQHVFAPINQLDRRLRPGVWKARVYE